MRLINLTFVVLLAISCGKDSGGGDGGDGDGDGDGDVIDANNGDGDGDGDGGTSQGTQGPNQFCDTLPEGGPYCMDGLECCADKVCRFDGDCGGSTGFIPCDCTADCPSSFLCCDTPDQTFCTKRSACNSYDGTEITTCP